MKLFRILILLTLVASLARAEEENVTTLKFSDPSQPGRLRVVISNGDLRIRGADVDAVTIRTTAKRDEGEVTRADGLRVISTSTQFSAVEENNVITLEYGQLGRGGDADFDLTVPRNTALQLQSNLGGDIDVEELTGDVEIKNMNGEITLRHLGGGALVETMNGEIDASFLQLPADKPLAFTSMNGEIK
ncbi:MAG TPA: hypothetical protein VHF69_11580, partial [Candidatus Synoicihabitans sp.]|nr:hypothetical protein [Candidatus Synoicihabitans sp.]